MGVLARVFEAAGLATVGLSLVRRQAENVKAPRFLHTEFPLGRPLGKPGDIEFQTDVLRRAFALLARTDAPVLEDHPVEIADESESPVACALPPVFDPALHPAIDEARALRPAYQRHLAAAGGRTALGRVADAESVEDLVSGFIALSEGAALSDVGFDVDSARAAGQDVRAYYEEAALALMDHVPAARQVESWFYTRTETGRAVKAAAAALAASGADRAIWYHLLPASQQ